MNPSLAIIRRKYGMLYMITMKKLMKRGYLNLRNGIVTSIKIWSILIFLLAVLGHNMNRLRKLESAA